MCFLECWHDVSCEFEMMILICDVMASAPELGFLSRMIVLRSARDVYRAQVHPAGPPPMMATSYSSTSISPSWSDVLLGVLA